MFFECPACRKRLEHASVQELRNGLHDCECGGVYQLIDSSRLKEIQRRSRARGFEPKVVYPFNERDMVVVFGPYQKEAEKATEEMPGPDKEEGTAT